MFMCMPGCVCPVGKVLNEEGICVEKAICRCLDSNNTIRMVMRGRFTIKLQIFKYICFSPMKFGIKVYAHNVLALIITSVVKRLHAQK